MSQDPCETDCHPLSMGDKAEGWKVSIFLGVGETVRNETGELGFQTKHIKQLQQLRSLAALLSIFIQGY